MNLIGWFKKETPEQIRARDLLEAQTLLLEYQKNVEWFAAMATAMNNRIHRLQMARVTYWQDTEKGLTQYGQERKQTQDCK